MAANNNRCGPGPEPGLSGLRILLVGSDPLEKSSARSIILNRNPSDVEKSEHCVKEEGEVAGRKISVIEAPGWCNDKTVDENMDLIKKEVVLGICMSSPGLHTVVPVVNGDRTFTRTDREILAAYLNLLGDSVWSHTIILFIFEDALGERTIEQYIEREGKDLQELVEKCQNRYCVFENMKVNDDSQVPELLMKVEEMVEKNGGRYFKLDTKVLPNLREGTSDKKTGMLEKFMKQRERKSHFIPHISRRHTEKSGEILRTQKTTPVQHCDREHSSADPELFTPEVVADDSEENNMDEYRFIFPRAGLFKCKLTNLMFEMEGKGNVQYSVLYWNNHILSDLGRKEPAGPLYNIDCPEHSVHRLHLPHCENRKDQAKLTVAHIIGQKTEFIQPRTVTDTHVTINVESLSPFGLTLPYNRPSIRAQVLIFYKMIAEHKIIKLHIYLLPANVPIAEVQKQHKDDIYINTTSDCDLISGKKYKLLCLGAAFVEEPSPEIVRFRRKYGPNYHPTFEVKLSQDTEITKVMVFILDKKDHVQWKSPDLMLPDSEGASANTDAGGADFVDHPMEELIQRVSSVMEIADCLYSKELLSHEEYNMIHGAATPQDRMRLLYRSLNSRGNTAKAEFYQILRKKEPWLMAELDHAVE